MVLTVVSTIDLYFEKNQQSPALTFVSFFFPVWSLDILSFLYKKQAFKFFLVYGPSDFRKNVFHTYWLNAVRLIWALWS